MPLHEFSDRISDRLQKLATPLVATGLWTPDRAIETVIDRLLDAWEERLSTHDMPDIFAGSTTASTPANPIQNDTQAPDLKFTKLRSAKIGSRALIQPTWSDLLRRMILNIPKERIAKDEDARKLIIVNFIRGKKEDEGYSYYPELDISVQGQKASYCWRGASHIARQLGISIEATFLWLERGASPGQMGHLSVRPEVAKAA